jgi:pentatricopeptide repeat protein
LIDAYGRAGRYKQAVEIFNNMRIYGCQPNLITYNAILSSCSKCDSWADAVVLLQCLQVQ